MEQGYYGKIETPREAIYEAACALDNQDVPLEDWPVKLIAALARAGFAVVPEHEVADLRRKLAADDASLTEATAEILRLRKIEAAARNLVMVKGRHHTEQAYARLAALMVPNA